MPAELPGLVADEEPEAYDPIAEVHQEVPDLLRGHGLSELAVNSEDMHVAGADLHHEQHVHTLKSDRAVQVEGSAASIVAVCACRNWRQVASVCRLGAGGILSALSTGRIVDALTMWPSLSSSPSIRWYPQP